MAVYPIGMTEKQVEILSQPEVKNYLESPKYRKWLQQTVLTNISNRMRVYTVLGPAVQKLTMSLVGGLIELQNINFANTHILFFVFPEKL